GLVASALLPDRCFLLRRSGDRSSYMALRVPGHRRLSPCRNVRHNNHRLDACRLATVSSRPRKTVRWDLVEIAASRTEEGDRELLCNDCFAGKSIRECERVLTLCPRTTDHPRWVETHLWQVLQSVGGYHPTLACFCSAGAATLQLPP